MEPKYQSISINHLILDNNNPRHDHLSSEAEIIKYMLNEEQLSNLLKDILDKGLTPIEFIAVMPNPGESGYIVLEGNRRISCLKIINNIDLLGSNKISKQLLHEIDKKKNDFKKVKCVVFENREQAAEWLQRKHGGQQNGIGTKSWDTRQQTRFNQQINSQSSNSLANSLLNHAKTIDIANADKKGLITTLTRFLSNPIFRNYIGLTSKTSDSEIAINIPQAVFDKILENLINDIADKDNKSISSRSLKPNIEKYGEELFKLYISNIEKIDEHIINPNHSKVGTSMNPEDKNSSTGANSTIDTNDLSRNESIVSSTSKSKLNSKRDPSKRKNLPSSNFICKTKNPILLSIYHELKQIDVELFPLSAALVGRAFIERISKVYATNITTKDFNRSQFVDVIKAIEAYTKENISNLDINEKPAYKIYEQLKNNNYSALSPIVLGINAHAGALPIPTDLKKEWLNVEPFIQYMLNQMD